ncbi:Peptidoglycan-associated lipoprotein [Paraburkholderia aspalathi]|uniref:OmpA family protein n=1 Tax=Paraburkholderia aspalathi TaxID=1324617 RepID=UPI00190D7594|nr:OmpA family protein [Paraburkholderia aspalathi]MBK3844486.1 OmpA family protein [Paraburkholderia aspalathi]CAE6873250.1 Peptidoglycan-associated lipoprotein [Paraburkholderia aspalathi]
MALDFGKLNAGTGAKQYSSFQELNTMQAWSKAGFTVVLAGILTLTGCHKKHDADVQAQAANQAPVAAPAPAAPPMASSAKFDIGSVAMSTAELPPFPYLDWPAGLDDGHKFVKTSEFDRIYVIAGNELRPVEGRYENRHFMNSDVKLSDLAAQRNYEAAIKALGGVKVSTMLPTNPAMLSQDNNDLGDLVVNKLRVAMSPDNYDYYLIRKPEGNVWIGLLVGGGYTQIITVTEGEMQTVVGFVKADDMQKALDEKGHIALYLNFDTDKAVIRQDDQAVIDEIGKLLAKSSSLKISIDGHTDNVGDEKHNQQLSKQRAEAVAAALVAKGVDKNRLQAQGFGASKPIADNTSEDGRSKNRRVELVRVDG